jgi:hypothetical protein
MLFKTAWVHEDICSGFMRCEISMEVVKIRPDLGVFGTGLLVAFLKNRRKFRRPAYRIP